MSDDLVKRARDCANGIGDMKTGRGDLGIFDDLADHIEELEADRRKTYEALLKVTRIHDEVEAKLSKAVESLTVIDALDPEGFVSGCSQSALKGLVLRMGELARTTLAELKGL